MWIFTYEVYFITNICHNHYVIIDVANTIESYLYCRVIDLKISDQLIVEEKEFIEDVVLVDISEKTLEGRAWLFLRAATGT